MTTDPKAAVLAKWPDARVYQTADGWSVWVGPTTTGFAGAGRTEAEAWADAAKRLAIAELAAHLDADGVELEGVTIGGETP